MEFIYKQNAIFDFCILEAHQLVECDHKNSFFASYHLILLTCIYFGDCLNAMDFPWHTNDDSGFRIKILNVFAVGQQSMSLASGTWPDDDCNMRLLPLEIFCLEKLVLPALKLCT